jgi:FAD/FMN-containing dehydrogenase
MAVLNGGHDPWGRGFLSENLVLNLRPMDRVRIDTEGRRAVVGGGALAGNLLDALPSDLAFAAGTVRSVGMAGLTMGGGYGLLTSRVGLASDNLLAARVVLADGSVAVASERDDADLLWALRGGGSGFGVVTEMTVALHRLPRLLHATIMVPLDQAGAALLTAQRLIDEHPDELGLYIVFALTPGGPALIQSALWSGAEAEGEQVVAALAGTSGAQVLQSGLKPYRDTFDPELEKAWPKGHHYHFAARMLRRLDDDAIEALLASARGISSPTDVIALHDFHGAPTRMPAGATAFPLREPHLVVEVIGGWNGRAGVDGAAHRAWVDGATERLDAVSMDGGYTNLLAPNETDRVRNFYGPAGVRLMAAKARVDPHDLFRAGIGRIGS